MNHDSSDRIVQAMRAWIATAPPGSRVPSTRALVAEHGASPVTVQRAMRTLAALGLVESRPGVGTFVRAQRSIEPVDYGWQTGALGAPPTPQLLSATQRGVAPDAIGLHAGYPAPELLPERLVRAAIARASRADTAVTRAPATGLPALQAWFASELASAAPSDITPASPHDVLIISGSQSGLSSVFRSLVGVGQPLLVESPTYWGAIVAARQAGTPLVPIPTSPLGPDPGALDRALAETGARAFYAQPTFSNPSGGQWPAEVGVRVLDLVRKHGAFLIEDDWAYDLGIDSEAHPIAAHDSDGHVVYLRSLTKSVSPALRVAALIARGPARGRILADRAAESMYVSPLLQAAALDVVMQPGWKSHLRAVRPKLRARRDALAAALAEHAPQAQLEHRPVGGLNLWMRLPDGVDTQGFARECEVRGVIVAPGDEWFPAEPPAPYARLNYSGTGPDRFEEAALMFGAALDDCARAA